jgi:hypothetical protein
MLAQDITRNCLTSASNKSIEYRTRNDKKILVHYSIIHYDAFTTINSANSDAMAC